jgi:hypothetical protein
LPENHEAAVLVETRFIATQTFHDDKAEEFAVLVHQLDGSSGHPDEHLLQRKVRRDALQVLETFEESLFFNKGLKEVSL